MRRSIAWSSSTAAFSATKRVEAVVSPRSPRESQPETAEKVWSSAHNPNASAPRPASSAGTATSVSRIVQRFPAPVAAVFSMTRRRNGRPGGESGGTLLPSASRPPSSPFKRGRGRPMWWG